MSEMEKQSELLVAKPIKRWYGIDIFRGIGILGIIFIHGVIMNYAQIDTIDLDNLPPYLMVIYIMDFWGGIYALISGTVNIYAIYQHAISVNEQADIGKFENTYEGYRWKYLFKYGFILLLLHFLYSYVLGPTYHDFETGIHKYSLIPGILRQGWGYSVNPERMVTSSALSMIALNLLVLGLLAFWLFRHNPKQKLKRNKRIFLILGFSFVSFAFFQIPLNIIYLNLVDANKYFPALVLGIFVGYPYPFFPFFGYGCIGAYFALVLAEKPTKKNLRRQLWLMLPFFLIGIIAFFLPNDFYEKYHLLDDIFMSYIMININLGLFVLFLFMALRIVDFSNIKPKMIEVKKPSKFFQFFISVGQYSLIIYLLETPVRELVASGLNALVPGWNDIIPNCFAFGGGLVILWVGLIFVFTGKKWGLDNKKWKRIGSR